MEVMISMRHTGKALSFLWGTAVGGVAGLLFLLALWLAVFKELRI